MRSTLLLFFLVITGTALADTVTIPLNRQYFHDKILSEQKLTDKADGKLDNVLHAGSNEEINLRLSDVLFRKTDELRMWVEREPLLTTNNDKVRYLSYIESLIRQFRTAWKSKDIAPVNLPELYESFERIMQAQLKNEPVIEYFVPLSYPVARIHSLVFFDNKAQKDIRKLVYLKFTYFNPDKILQTIRPFAEESFADSLIVVASRKDPVQLYSYAQNRNSVEGKLIHRNPDPMVKAVADLSHTPNALFYFPFLDKLLNGSITIDNIKQYVGDGEKGYDSVGYYKLLVKTEVDYFKRMAPPMRDTPVAMFGANGLREMLRKKSIQHFITPINELHNVSNVDVRMRAIDPLTPEELYFMMVMGENDIYTSSYKHSFNRMLARMGDKPRGDKLLQAVHFDHFKKFIKMAASYNKLDTFLKSMPAASSEVLMRAFVANLHTTGNLEDAVDVADSYSSINDKKLLTTILSYVEQNEKAAIGARDNRGMVIYGLLKTIFRSANDPSVDLTGILGIPSIYEVPAKEMKDEKGNIVQQVFFYGDEDGKIFFPMFVNSFSSKDWKVTMKKEWVEIKSLKGNVWVFANRPLDNNENLDDSAQVHLARYLENVGLQPTMVVHRGHSYWLPRTIQMLPESARIIVLGSCGGYKNLNQILEVCPEAHIISTKEIGKGDINQPITNYLNNAFIQGQPIVWKDMWASLSRTFRNDPNREVRESWEDYIPPYRNLGAIFLKAYNRRMESQK